MSRILIAVALATALVTLCPTQSRAEIKIHLDPAPQWRQAEDLDALVEILESWLDAESSWERREEKPKIRLSSSAEASARLGATASFQRGRLRGLYDPDGSVIVLVRPWNPSRAEDVSVLLHELVHHRQAPLHWYCPAAQELSAYRLQDAWLNERGLRADVNWVAVVLDAGCTPRDIHPG
ncbi:DUF6647 family protein [Salipiger mucosus]|uniref:DUF6647 domain-containing protein n=1 Tax=Salipiger mucosus DSM 16094 TaxID=1123237 RepID=S9SC82_9RHOB|nr:DUF6647 family protein [Salipiger mucosus]EPX83849.1 hypothetical protein Salmuc_01624 [Salipiger mucosus DSM 16094]